MSSLPLSLCSSTLDFHTELCRMGLGLLIDLLKKSSSLLPRSPPSPFLLLTFPSVSSHNSPFLLFPTFTIPFPHLSAPTHLFFLSFSTPLPHRNKSDKIRDCISPLSSPSLKRVSCLRRGVPDFTHQTFVTFQWDSYFSPPHLVRHQPIIDRLWIREVEGETRAFSRLLLSVFAAICSAECYETNAGGGNRIFSAWMTVYKRCQVVVQYGLNKRYTQRGGAKGENKKMKRKDGKNQRRNK